MTCLIYNKLIFNIVTVLKFLLEIRIKTIQKKYTLSGTGFPECKYTDFTIPEGFCREAFRNNFAGNMTGWQGVLRILSFFL